jgi:hypothetical protein
LAVIERRVATAEGVYDIEQEPAESVHDPCCENVPVALLFQVTVPVGERPFTVAVHRVGAPTATDGGPQVTVAASALGVKIVSDSTQPSLLA